MDGMCQAKTVAEALTEVASVMQLGHNLWAYAYMRKLYQRAPDLYYATLLAKPSELLPVVYTPTVGEACQKFGKMPFAARGCYVAVTMKGRVMDVLKDYAAANLEPAGNGKYYVDCIVFSDGGV